MYEDLNLILKSIKEKTRIDVDVFNDALVPVVTTRNSFLDAIPPRADFDEIAFDRKNNKTYFRFRFLEASYVGSINGVSEVERNYACLFINLLENVSDQDDDLSKEEKLKRILYGESSKRQIVKFSHDYSVDDLLRYVFVVKSARTDSREIAHFMQKKLVSEDFVLTLDPNTTVIVHAEDKAGDRESPTEFGIEIYKELTKEFTSDLTVGVGGGVEKFKSIDESYKQAVSALKLNDYYFMKTPVHSYADYMLIQMLESLPRFKLMEYLDMILGEDGKELFEDEEMVQTAEAFFENDLNVSEAARELYMHRNTLMYRLDKIQKATNLNIKNFSDAVTFRIISIIKKLLD